jgi:hypothetical protein
MLWENPLAGLSKEFQKSGFTGFQIRTVSILVINGLCLPRVFASKTVHKLIKIGSPPYQAGLFFS